MLGSRNLRAVLRPKLLLIKNFSDIQVQPEVTKHYPIRTNNVSEHIKASTFLLCIRRKHIHWIVHAKDIAIKINKQIEQKKQ